MDTDETWRDDPVARRTSFGPARRGGWMIRAAQTRRERATKIVVTATPLRRLIVWGAFGVGAVTGLISLSWSGEQAWILWLATLAFPIAGVVMRRGARPFSLDRALGIYWRGSRRPSPRMLSGSDEDAGRLDDVHALQLVTETISGQAEYGGSTSFDSHEVNLVLKDGRRVNVSDHADLRASRADAKAIARLLEVPVWDAASG